MHHFPGGGWRACSLPVFTDPLISLSLSLWGGTHLGSKSFKYLVSAALLLTNNKITPSPPRPPPPVPDSPSMRILFPL